jgi:hypothetical protein
MSEKDIPDTIKEDNWRLYEQAMSPDPAIGPQYAVKLVNHLITTMKMGGIIDYDTDLDDALKLSKEALARYAADTHAGHEGEALMLTSDAMQKIGHIIYDKEERFAKRDKYAFTGKGGA